MGRLVFAFFVLILVSCKNFDGLAGRSGEYYTNVYNYPTSRIAPYNNPLLDMPEDPGKINFCTGSTDSIRGFSCYPQKEIFEQ